MLRRITEELIVDIDRIIYVDHKKGITKICLSADGHEAKYLIEVDEDKKIWEELYLRNST